MVPFPEDGYTPELANIGATSGHGSSWTSWHTRLHSRGHCWHRILKISTDEADSYCEPGRCQIYQCWRRGIRVWGCVRKRAIPFRLYAQPVSTTGAAAGPLREQRTVLTLIFSCIAQTTCAPKERRMSWCKYIPQSRVTGHINHRHHTRCCR